MRRLGSVLRVGSVLAATALFIAGVRVNAHNRHDQGRFDLVEATISSIEEAFEDGVITPEQLVRMYRSRIAAYDSRETATHLNSYIAFNDDAVREAKHVNRGRGHRHRDRPLSGIPVILKDNIDTEDMPTTAGSLALRGSIPKSDAFVTRQLRNAGAIIIGKATMTEYANFLTNGMPAGYSSLGGYGFNPYDPRPDPRAVPDTFGR